MFFTFVPLSSWEGSFPFSCEQWTTWNLANHLRLSASTPQFAEDGFIVGPNASEEDERAPCWPRGEHGVEDFRAEGWAYQQNGYNNINNCYSNSRYSNYSMWFTSHMYNHYSPKYRTIDLIMENSVRRCPWCVPAQFLTSPWRCHQGILAFSGI